MALPAPLSSAETIQRLSHKPGVLCTMTIDKASHTVLSSTGSVSSLLLQQSPSPVVQSTDSATGSGAEEDKTNEFVQMIWKYVDDSEHMMQKIDDEDELKLMRLRTKKHELVIVPDSKFIFVVVNDVKSS